MGQILKANEYDRAKLYHLLVSELEDFAVFLVDLQGQITSWNPGVERFFGFTEDDFVGTDFGSIFTPEDRAAGAPESELARARKDGRSSDIRWHLCQDQSRVFVEGVLCAITDEDGTLMGFAKIARAVRPRHAAGTMLSTVLDGTEDAIYVLDASGRFVFANEQTARLLHRSMDEIIGRTRAEILPAHVERSLRSTDEIVMRTRSPQVIEERFPADGRGERVMLTTKAPWQSPEGGLIGIVAIAKDITARSAYQSERERLLREVRRSNEELSTFSHVVAHDLRAPLRSVKIYTELLAKRLQSAQDPTTQQFIRFVVDGAENMEQLIISLLRYAESGDELELHRVNTTALLDGLRQTLEPVMDEAGATISYGALPDVDADPVRLLQVFQNLIVNAIKYRGPEPPRIEIRATRSDNQHVFAVSDNGAGIPHEYLEHIFIPLKRLHGRSIPGSGIGLALCRKIIDLHGGRIWVESEPGQGSTFFFTLPVVEERSPALSVPPARRP